MDSNVVTAPNGQTIYMVPGFPTKPLLPAVMMDRTGQPIGSIDQGDGTSAVKAVQIGAPVQLLYSEPPTTRTADGNAGGLTSTPTTQSITGLFLGINVTAATGTLVVYLQQQDANTAWQNIANTAGISAVGTASLSVGGGYAVPAMLNGGPYRISWTITGASASFTFQLSLQGR